VVDFDNASEFYYAMLLLLVGVFVFLRVMLASRFGHALQGIRSNEHRMRAIGFNVYAYKLAAFTIAGALAGTAGYFSAVQFGVVNPEIMSWHQSGNALLMVILGGMGNLVGSILGAFAFVLLQDFFASLTKHWQLLMGGFVIASVAFLPRGLVHLDALWKSVRGGDHHG
jgi:branched-chain amino acid transport system permease protein